MICKNQVEESMRCQWSEWILWAESSPPKWLRRLAESHVQSCESCRKQHAKQMECTRILQHTAMQDEKKVSDFTHHKIMDQIQSLDKNQEQVTTRSSHRPQLALVALLLVMIGGIGLYLKQKPAQQLPEQNLPDEMQLISKSLDFVPVLLDAPETFSMGELEKLKHDVALVLSPIQESASYFLEPYGDTSLSVNEKEEDTN